MSETSDVKCNLSIVAVIAGHEEDLFRRLHTSTIRYFRI